MSCKGKGGRIKATAKVTSIKATAKSAKVSLQVPVARAGRGLKRKCVGNEDDNVEEMDQAEFRIGELGDGKIQLLDVSTRVQSVLSKIGLDDPAALLVWNVDNVAAAVAVINVGVTLEPLLDQQPRRGSAVAFFLPPPPISCRVL